MASRLLHIFSLNCLDTIYCLNSNEVINSTSQVAIQNMEETR